MEGGEKDGLTVRIRDEINRRAARVKGGEMEGQ